MRRIAFIIGIIGLGFLVGFLLVEGFNIENLDGLIVGDIVSISGMVEEERKFGSGKLMVVGDIQIYCECENYYSGKNVFVEGVIERFPEDLRIKALYIKVLD